MSSERECFVYIVLPGATEFVTAGRFRVITDRSGVARGSFVYGKSYLARPDAVEFDPVELRLAPRVYETVRLDGFFGAIRDSMPDYWGRRVIEKHAGLTVLEEFDYLLQGPDDRAGALGFGLNVTPPAPRRAFNSTLDLARLQAAADAIMADDADRADEIIAQAGNLVDPGTSMGGARPKAVVQDDGSLWIAKFSAREDRFNYPRVEHGMLRLAAECGLHVADSRLETVGGKDVLLVRRFDRDPTESDYRRHRMVSALTLLRTGDQPEDRAQWSYLLLADEIRRVSAATEADLRELFGRICFNAAVSNLDDHPRNHAVLGKDRSWRLSPAYDLTPTPAIAEERRDLAMTCGPYGRYANRLNLIAGHGRFLLSEDDAAAIFDHIAATAKERWRPLMRSIGVTERDCEIIARAFVYGGLILQEREA
ncbi:MAG: type II toxin-antitoxin system HipA family toxin [Methylocystis sp.]